MKKLLIVFAAGAFLTSCSSPEDEAGAAAFCECHSITNAADEIDLLEIIEAVEQTSDCYKKFQADFEGKMSQDGFKAELSEKCPEALPKAEEMGLFK